VTRLSGFHAFPGTDSDRLLTGSVTCLVTADTDHWRFTINSGTFAVAPGFPAYCLGLILERNASVHLSENK
jgi:hypothetical protein